MPLCSGLEVCRRIRGNDKTRRMLVVLFSTAPERFMLGHMLEAGADDYVSKMCGALVVKTKVREMLHMD